MLSGRREAEESAKITSFSFIGLRE